MVISQVYNISIKHLKPFKYMDIEFGCQNDVVPASELKIGIFGQVIELQILTYGYKSLHMSYKKCNLSVVNRTII